ncbi:hypothetical protein [Saccharicrinis aurantiacus]|uniref:hypothetical protein n=1 Tax=Saccharicrinis aurantiacus TaxID=1849719 RepID=UPI002491C0D4|nr:hypothetical protein [Saccharicrinis aurantiacus]
MRLILFIILALTINLSLVKAQNENIVDTCNYALDVYSSEGIKELNIKSLHAKINIHNWDKETVSVESTVKILTPKLIVAEELLALIEVEAKNTKDAINIITTLSKDFSSTVPYEITHNIFVPEHVAFNITNNHGNVVIPKTTSGVNLKLNYCSLIVNDIQAELAETKNYLNLKFCKADINLLGNASINSNSSEILITKCDSILLKSEYSNISILDNRKLDGDTNLDKIQIDKTDNIILLGKYSAIKLDYFSTDGKIELEEGKLNINGSSNNFSSLLISNNNTPTSIKLNPSASYIINGEVKDAKINHPNTSDLDLIKDNNKTSFSGVIGDNPNTNSRVIVFNKNKDITFD